MRSEHDHRFRRYRVRSRKGKARIDGNGIFAENDYEIVVRAKITNEYGTFYGEEFVFNKGKKKLKKAARAEFPLWEFYRSRRR